MSILLNFFQRVTLRCYTRLRDIIPARFKKFIKPLVKSQANRLAHIAAPRLLTKEMLLLNQSAAKQYCVESAVHPDDFVFWYILNSPSFPSIEAAIEYYFENGNHSAKLFTDIIASLGIKRGPPVKLLEFGAGYGCVSRHLKKKSLFDLISCDIHPAAVDFLAKQIGVETIHSAHIPEEFLPSSKFDVVFALSFFSHMPKVSFGRWLHALFYSLNAPGYLVFTTHGLVSHKIIGSPSLSTDGFWFNPASEQKDLAVYEYGTSICTQDFVKAEVLRQTGASIFTYKQALWWDHQDLWVIKREK